MQNREQGRVLIVAGSDSGRWRRHSGGYQERYRDGRLRHDGRHRDHGPEHARRYRHSRSAAGYRRRADARCDGGSRRRRGQDRHAAQCGVVEAVAEELSRTEELLSSSSIRLSIAKGGASLLEASAVSALKEVLIPLSALVTPNIPEAEVLTGRKIVDVEGQKAAADALLGLGADAVLVKGGHLSGDLIFDVLATQETIQVFSSPRIDTRHTHGTGCALASSIAALLAQGIDLTAAVAAARDYVHEAIRTAPGFGQGHGPLNFLAAVDDGEL